MVRAVAMTASIPDLADVFRSQERFVWSLCYRMTGNAADADDLVQETFVRAMEHPPARPEEPLRPWLVRVAMNLGRDLLRRRRRRGYAGPWLPSPIETPAEDALPSYELAGERGLSTEGRYEMMESVSYAFLLALEALTPQQRAVLLLRDVFDYSVAEAAEALGLSEPNVKTTHHRARRAMRDYDQQRCVPTRALQERTRAALEQLLVGLMHRDIAAIEALLAADVCSLSDGGGEFAAALNPVNGRRRVTRLALGLSSRAGWMRAVEVRMVNGLPALFAEFGTHGPRFAPCGIVRCEIDAAGRITALHTILASGKLSAIRRAAAA